MDFVVCALGRCIGRGRTPFFCKTRFPSVSNVINRTKTLFCTCSSTMGLCAFVSGRKGNESFFGVAAPPPSPSPSKKEISSACRSKPYTTQLHLTKGDLIICHIVYLYTSSTHVIWVIDFFSKSIQKFSAPQHSNPCFRLASDHPNELERPQKYICRLVWALKASGSSVPGAQ